MNSDSVNSMKARKKRSKLKHAKLKDDVED